MGQSSHLLESTVWAFHCKVPCRTFQPQTFQPQTFQPWTFHSTRGLGLRSSWLKSLGLRSPGLNLGIGKSGIGMSCNLWPLMATGYETCESFTLWVTWFCWYFKMEFSILVDCASAPLPDVHLEWADCQAHRRRCRPWLPQRRAYPERSCTYTPVWPWKKSKVSIQISALN